MIGYEIKPNEVNDKRKKIKVLVCLRTIQKYNERAAVIKMIVILINE